MNKSIFIKIMYFAFVFLTGLQTAGLIDIIPIANEQTKEIVKWSVAVILAGLGIFFAKPIETKIGGGGITNPPPKK